MSAPMAMHSGGTLAAAVSEAGGLGTFGGVNPVGGVGWVRDEIARVKKATTKPFGVGFITHFLPMFGELFDATLDAGVPVIALSFAPAASWLARAHDAGSLVICQVQTRELARDAVDAGADAIAVQGIEAGGHTGPAPLLPFLMQVLDEFPDVPVLAAGGIATGRALASVIAAGADGAWIGTAFLATNEAVEVPDAYKQLIVESDGHDTVFTTLFDRLAGMPWPEPIGVRMRRHPLLDEWVGRENDALAHADELRAAVNLAGPFDPKTSPALYGPAAGSVNAVRPAGDVVRELAADAETFLNAAGRPG
jgi:nitronate monooxygenase